MRIRNIKIKDWRHFRDIELHLGPDAGLVCVVGANGTGKSHLLELIASCAHRLGLSRGVETPRGDPFSDRHDFSMQFFLAKGGAETIDQWVDADPSRSRWDRTLTISDRQGESGSNGAITAGGIADPNESKQFAQTVVSQLKESNEVYFLSLDADRAYPKKNINFNELAQAYETDWEGIEYTRGRSFKSTTTLYDEWIKYCLALENQAGTTLVQAMRRSKAANTAAPEFQDHFAAYADSLQRVLPHVVFSGVDSKKRTLLFDTTGLQLSFDQLSGGEREITFLIGQIDRFGLRRGLFLLDEPELHLNADLIRTWITHLTGTIATGQVWLATHSLEAVEAAGQHATFVLERNEDSRIVDSVARLDARPVLSALSRAVGSPAFSISKIAFVFVEGEEGVGEREQFQRLAGTVRDTRFLECGSCTEVVRRVLAIRSLAEEVDAPIHVGGIVDRDFMRGSEARSLQESTGVLVLPVHEIENLFLNPKTLRCLLDRNGRADTDPLDLIRLATDRRAGSWIFQYAMATPNARALPEISATAKDALKSQSWEQVRGDTSATIQAVLDSCQFAEAESVKFDRILQIGVRAFEKIRMSGDLWKRCEGKQVLSDLARGVGFADGPTLIRATFTLWESDPLLVPAELMVVRQYVSVL